VFQHIPPRRGAAMLAKMLDMLEEGGVGALQFTYAFGSSTPWARRFLTQAYDKVPGAWSFRNLLKGRPIGEPLMQMNEYDLNRLFRILHEGGCHSIHTRHTETMVFGQRLYGVLLLFQKRRTAGTEHL
jgi:hypothetical protein